MPEHRKFSDDTDDNMDKIYAFIDSLLHMGRFKYVRAILNQFYEELIYSDEPDINEILTYLTATVCVHEEMESGKGTIKNIRNMIIDEAKRRLPDLPENLFWGLKK
jgi:hypothetical protein